MHPLVRLHPAEVSKRIWKKPDEKTAGFMYT
jgi:hypothetical protein